MAALSCGTLAAYKINLASTYEQFQDLQIHIEYVNTKEQVADIFTKALPPQNWDHALRLMGLLYSASPCKSQETSGAARPAPAAPAQCSACCATAERYPTAEALKRPRRSGQYVKKTYKVLRNQGRTLCGLLRASSEPASTGTRSQGMTLCSLLWAPSAPASTRKWLPPCSASTSNRHQDIHRHVSAGKEGSKVPLKACALPKTKIFQVRTSALGMGVVRRLHTPPLTTSKRTRQRDVDNTHTMRPCWKAWAAVVRNP